jgi:hypothetical protein
MIYAGQINKDIVAQLQANANAWDSGADGNLSSLIKISTCYGFVGDVKKVTPSFIDITKQRNNSCFLCNYTIKRTITKHKCRYNCKRINNSII